MIELPELFERHMTLGKQAVKDGNLEEARSHFEDAYGLKDDMEANVSLVNVLVALKEYQEAYDILKEKKSLFRRNVLSRYLFSSTPTSKAIFRYRKTICQLSR